MQPSVAVDLASWNVDDNFSLTIAIQGQYFNRGNVAEITTVEVKVTAPYQSGLD